MEKYSDRFPKCSRGATKSEKIFLNNWREESDLVFAIATPISSKLSQYDENNAGCLLSCDRPIGSEIGEELERAWGNITGTSDQSEDAISTQVDMIKQVLPTTKTVGILYTQSEPNSVVQKDNAKKILEAKGYQVVEKTILDSNNVKAAADSIMSEADIVFVPTDNIISSTMDTVKQVSISHKVLRFWWIC